MKSSFQQTRGNFFKLFTSLSAAPNIFQRSLVVAHIYRFLTIKIYGRGREGLSPQTNNNNGPDGDSLR